MHFDWVGLKFPRDSRSGSFLGVVNDSCQGQGCAGVPWRAFP